MIKISFPKNINSISMKNYLKFAVMFKDSELNHFNTILLTFERKEFSSIDLAWAVCRSIVQHLNYRHKTSYRLRRNKQYIFFYIDFYTLGWTDKLPFSKNEFQLFLNHIREVCNYIKIKDTIEIETLETEETVRKEMLQNEKKYFKI